MSTYQLTESITKAAVNLSSTMFNYIECISDSEEEDLEIVEDTLEYIKNELEAVRIELEKSHTARNEWEDKLLKQSS